MDDTISRQAVYNLIEKLAFNSCIDKRTKIMFVNADLLVNEMYSLPPVQQEIVRCKDCKWSVEHYDTDGNVPYWVCKNWDSGTDADGFCHEAERRTDEQLGKGESDD